MATTVALGGAFFSQLFSDVILLFYPIRQYLAGFLLVATATLIYYVIVIVANKDDTVMLFKKLKGLPYGKQVFSFLIGVVSPYSGSLKFLIEEVDYTGATAMIKQRRFIQNPFGTVHLAAIINFGELAAALPFMAAVGKVGKRAMPVAVHAEFAKKSTGTLRAISEKLSVPEKQDRYEVTSRIVNSAGDVCATVRVTFAISDIPAAKKSN